MGVCQSQEDKEQLNKSKAIDKEMMQGHLAQQKVVKLLLLGAGECGKSTVLKQMRFVIILTEYSSCPRILHDHGFSKEESEQQKSVVYNNTIMGMVVILRAMSTLGIPFDNPDREVSYCCCCPANLINFFRPIRE